ncbi:Extracellular ligand-binding receptor [Candidatus Propionivibrio aalborgensis]|jgi:branched-chain amino acid transport system substrate-binding protein|uniref:Extracellular ligand-binding receptor n=1 Tax=Candidatus Propionivibrio aalborgensis TaxID=1860101 RepID=A0A1A8XT94_9RHOO|nr:ABC transporter substrate-binding protein [Candidatus Propionivibrio aalborgensis]SBT08290.1 Extracellular ligand-binding receptor [Candidatus Propionivibrio aalborgensis]
MIKTLKNTALIITLLIFAGQALAEIVIGQVTPLSGPLAPTGSHIRAGAQLYFDAVNAKGGVHGEKIRLVTKDDAYKAAETVRLAKELINEVQPLALFGFVGTGNAEAILKDKILSNAGIPLVMIRSGASAVVKSGNPWLFITRASYEAEINKIIQQYSLTGYRTYAVLYQDDPFGLDVLGSTEALVGKFDSKIVAKAGYKKNTTEVSEAVKTIAAAAPHAVIMISNTAASSEFLKQSRAAGNNAQFITISVTDAAQVVERIGKDVANGLALTQVFPDPESRSIPLTREIMENFSKFKPSGEITPNQTLVEGYVGAKVLVEGLRRAGPKPTRQKLRDALEQIKDYDTGDLYVGFSPTNHSGVHYVDITIINREGKLLK